MGYGTAISMKGAELRGEIREYAALHYHLTANHYPPIPEAMIPVAQRAIMLASDGLYDEEIELPEGWIVNGKHALTVREVVDIMHLQAFIQ